MSYLHQNLARGKWQNMTISEQMANIGSEVHRFLAWQQKNQTEKSVNSYTRSVELINLTIDSNITEPQRRELNQLKTLLCDLKDNYEPHSSHHLDKYFIPFALKVRKNNHLT